jgi:predicted RNA-binding protein with PUA-like domain
MKNGEVKWVSVKLKYDRALKNPVTLSTIKATPELSDLPLIRQSRLSVMPVSRESFRLILALSEGDSING